MISEGIHYVEIKFHQGLFAQNVTQTVDQIESTIRSQYPDISNIFVEAKLLTRR